MPITPAASRPIGRTSRSLKRPILPSAEARMMSSSPDETATHASSSLFRHGDRPDAGRADALELLDRRLLDDPLARGHDHVRALLEVRDRHDGEDQLPRFELDALEVDDRNALARPLGRCRDRVHLGAEDSAAIGEEERPVVRARDEQVLDGVLLDRLRADDALAAADLAAIRRERLALDVAARRDRDHDVLVGDQVLVGQLAVRVALDPSQSDAGVLGRTARAARP